MRCEIICVLPLVLAAAAFPALAAEKTDAKRPTARQIVERIKQHVGVPWTDKNTVDTFRVGDPDTPVTGIVTTWMATLDVLKRTAASGNNLIITHEPTFYQGHDAAEWAKTDKVAIEKRAFIEKHKLVVWRFHDYWHRRPYDGILQGAVEKLGWAAYPRPDHSHLSQSTESIHAINPGVESEARIRRRIFQVPETTLAKLADEMKRKFHAGAVRVVGDPRMKLTKVGVLPGCPFSIDQVQMLQREDLEVLVAGETREWETVEYVRDAVASGRHKALVLLGHEASEEPGMEYCATWLKTFIQEVPIQHISAGEPYWSPR